MGTENIKDGGIDQTTDEKYDPEKSNDNSPKTLPNETTSNNEHTTSISNSHDIQEGEKTSSKAITKVNDVIWEQDSVDKNQDIVNNNDNIEKELQAKATCDNEVKSNFISEKETQSSVINVRNAQVNGESEKCDYSTNQKYLLQRHVKIVHDKTRPFKCSKCEMSFGQKAHLSSNHRSIHYEIRSFNCDYCSHSASEKDNPLIKDLNEDLNVIEPSTKKDLTLFDVPTYASIVRNEPNIHMSQSYMMENGQSYVGKPKVISLQSSNAYDQNNGGPTQSFSNSNANGETRTQNANNGWTQKEKDFVPDSKTGIVKMKESSEPVNLKVTSIKDEECKRIQSDVEIIDFFEKKNRW